MRAPTRYQEKKLMEFAYSEKINAFR